MHRSFWPFNLFVFCIISIGTLQGNEDVWLSADLFYWKAYEKSFVYTNRTSPVFTTDNFTKAKVLDPDFDWNFGSRLSLGYFYPCYSSDAVLSWTHYHTSINQKQLTDSNDLINVNNQRGMFPIWSFSDDIIAGDYVSDAFMRGRLALDLFDLDMGGHFDYSECLQVRVYLGLRGVWIRQSANVKYRGGIFLIGIIDGGIPLNGTDFIHLRNNFWGIGPRFGIAPEFNLGGDFSLHGDMAISGVIGSFSLHQKEKYLGHVRFSHDSHPTKFRWIGDLALWLAWKTCLCDGMYPLTLKLGWEYHIFFHQMQLRRDNFHLIPGNRNLAVQGVSFGADFEF